MKLGLLSKPERTISWGASDRRPAGRGGSTTISPEEIGGDPVRFIEKDEAGDGPTAVGVVTTPVGAGGRDVGSCSDARRLPGEAQL